MIKAVKNFQSFITDFYNSREINEEKKHMLDSLNYDSDNTWELKKHIENFILKFFQKLEQQKLIKINYLTELYDRNIDNYIYSFFARSCKRCTFKAELWAVIDNIVFIKKLTYDFVENNLKNILKEFVFDLCCDTSVILEFSSKAV